MVLVVEDDEANRETLRAVLEEERYPVIEAADGQTALDLLRASPQALVVVLDLVLPGHVDGGDVLQAAAQDPALGARHAFLLMTASPQRLTPVIEALAAQLTAPVMQKPFDLDELLATVARVAARVGSRALA
jgi:CheY-like chemotaxis protein